MPREEGAGDVAVVTGAASGIGRRVLERLVVEGWRVVACDRDAAALERLHGDLEPAGAARVVGILAGDVRDAEHHLAAVALAETHGPVRAAVCAAGVSGRYGLLAESEPDTWREVLEVNTVGCYLALRAVLPAIARAGGGSAVLLASVLGRVAEAGFSAYVASKHAVVGLAKAAALEGAPDGVRVNAVLPGYTDTPMLRGSSSATEIEGIAAATPLGRLARPEEIADAVAYLIDPRAAYVTGAELVVDGGFVIR